MVYFAIICPSRKLTPAKIEIKLGHKRINQGSRKLHPCEKTTITVIWRGEMTVQTVLNQDLQLVIMLQPLQGVVSPGHQADSVTGLMLSERRRGGGLEK